ncbi:DUF3489 domain-containing protein [Hydrogenophaga sp.]|uniref:DUF3489 domain-containing protein n=1 Tax=Hydrogenophaga sp. TaxID=1904254 RepID=UPI0027293BD9|nr:DUF3489 domain-containing protein [Hydrogenophaga sp.]MDO9435322.1 DUF3489 domain-containing protein [Hydrogenophaga sp.]
MKRSSLNSTKSRQVLAKRRPASPKPGARKTSQASSSKAPTKAGLPSFRKCATAAAKPSPVAPVHSKQSQLMDLLGVASGASMAQLTALTGWQPHTVRSTISVSLRKRLGLNVQCLVQEGVRVYRIVEASAP